ncbi:MAG TPA: 2-oxoacid:acceptor oxidoreductase subunit alpha [Dehalococcoidia bacterium]|nr:2-oxoacid:acceptor oxidoreductase subunit alpha [Dehalococcoidia bacterium]
MTTAAPASNVMTGQHFMNGDLACAEGALAAGCTFFAGYPITPSTEIAERLARRLPEIGGTYVQMEDELASMAAILGAAWTGVKAMTATSGPGFTLMMENIGLGMMTETPCVVVDVQRGGPSTGLPTLVSQADVMQAKWGSHGDYEPIAYAPSTPQEMFDYTIKAFNAAERYRLPAFVLADEAVGHMTERVTIPSPSELVLVDRRRPVAPPDDGWLPYGVGDDLVPAMVRAGDGYAIHVTGLTHDERGYPVVESQVHERMVRRISRKVQMHAPEICEYEKFMTDDANVVVIAYGATARSARRAVLAARETGIRAGMLRLITLWPFPAGAVKEMANVVRRFVVAEVNLGQVAREVERYTRRPVNWINHAGGTMVTPEAILRGIVQVKP